MAEYDELFEIFLQRGAHDVHFPEGWTSIMEKLHAGLQALDPDYRVSQVKVKFDSLRVYLPHYPDGATELIRAAESEAYRTCERCGDAGVRRKGWFILCDEHAEGREPLAVG